MTTDRTDQEQAALDRQIASVTAWRNASVDSFNGRIEGMAERLEDLATRIRRAAKATEGPHVVGDPLRWVQAATEIQHELSWGFANLNADSLTYKAGEIQMNETKLETLIGAS